VENSDLFFPPPTNRKDKKMDLVFDIGDIVKVTGVVYAGYEHQFHGILPVQIAGKVGAEWNTRKVWRDDFTEHKKVGLTPKTFEGMVVGTTHVKTGTVEGGWYPDGGGEPTWFNTNGSIRVVKVIPLGDRRYRKPVNCLPEQLEIVVGHVQLMSAWERFENDMDEALQRVGAK
jgi:hypothetical protein